MKKIIISFLLLQLSLAADSTKVVIEPVSNTIVNEIGTEGFFSFKVIPNGDPITGLAETDLDGALKLGEATLANCQPDSENWKCKPSIAISYGKHILTVASSESKIKELPIEITEEKKEVEIIYAISATPKTAQVTGAITANSQIEITLTANALTTAAVTGAALSDYFKLGEINLGTCTGEGLTNAATAGTTADIKCVNSQEIAVSATSYVLKLQDSKTAVSDMSIGVSGSVTVSASGNPGDNTGGNTGGNTDGGNTGGNTDSGNTGGNTDSGNTGGNTDSGNTGGNTDSGNTGDNTSSGDNQTDEDKDSSFYLKNCLLVLLAILF